MQGYSIHGMTTCQIHFLMQWTQRGRFFKSITFNGTWVPKCAWCLWNCPTGCPADEQTICTGAAVCISYLLANYPAQLLPHCPCPAKTLKISFSKSTSSAFSVLPMPLWFQGQPWEERKPSSCPRGTKPNAPCLLSVLQAVGFSHPQLLLFSWQDAAKTTRLDMWGLDPWPSSLEAALKQPERVAKRTDGESRIKNKIML